MVVLTLIGTAVGSVALFLLICLGKSSPLVLLICL